MVGCGVLDATTSHCRAYDISASGQCGRANGKKAWVSGWVFSFYGMH